VLSGFPDETRARRLFGLELRSLAKRRLLSAAVPRSALARLLRASLRHRGGDRDLLPTAEARGGRELGQVESAGVSVRDQGQPLHQTPEAAARRRHRRPQLLRTARAVGALAEAGAGVVSAAGD